MPETELDGRLRAALAQPVEPEASAHRLGALRNALPARRARRARRRLTAGSAAAVAALGVVLGVLVPGTGAPPPRLAAPNHAAEGPSCVELVVGSAGPECAGSVLPFAASASAAVPTYRSAAPAPLTVRAGSRVVVSLPRLSGVTWTTVVVTATRGAGVPAARTYVVHAGRDGRSMANLGSLVAGSYTLAATAHRPCSGAGACATGAVQWSVALTSN